MANELGWFLESELSRTCSVPGLYPELGEGGGVSARDKRPCGRCVRALPETGGTDALDIGVVLDELIWIEVYMSSAMSGEEEKRYQDYGDPEEATSDHGWRRI
jgi:hypothetical protein